MTRSNTTLRLARLTAAVVAAAATAGCATFFQPTREEAVARRAQERWDLLVKGDLQKAYGFFSPSTRAVTSFEAWKELGVPRSTVWKKAQVIKVECPDEQRCVARVNLDHQPLVLEGRLGTISSAIDETWLVDNGEWWLLYRR